MLPSDPILKPLSPKLLVSLHKPVSAIATTENKLEAIRRLIQLLQEAGFTAG